MNMSGECQVHVADGRLPLASAPHSLPPHDPAIKQTLDGKAGRPGLAGC